MSIIYWPLALDLVEFRDYPTTRTTSYDILKKSILEDSTEDAYHKNRHVQNGLKFSKIATGPGKDGNLSYYTHINNVVGSNYGDKTYNSSTAVDLTTYNQSFSNIYLYSFVYDIKYNYL